MRRTWPSDNAATTAMTHGGSCLAPSVMTIVVAHFSTSLILHDTVPSGIGRTRNPRGRRRLRKVHRTQVHPHDIHRRAPLGSAVSTASRGICARSNNRNSKGSQALQISRRELHRSTCPVPKATGHRSSSEGETCLHFLIYSSILINLSVSFVFSFPK